jgi:hypothetical protein
MAKGSYRKKRQGSRKATRRGSRRQRGGGAGIGGYTFGGPITPGAPIGNTAEVLPMDSCLAVQRPGMISPSTGQGQGLPGMSGGRRRRGSRRMQRGGRYTFDLSAPLAPAAPWAGGIPQAVRIPCEGSIPNPLNPGPHTPSTQPAIQSGGVGGVDSAYYAAPTAGYSNMPSSWVGSTGAPSLLQQPYDARTLNPACLKTGGGKRRRKQRGTHRRRR